MKNQACQTKHSQSGNVLIIIFIAIALFAALSYVLMKTSRSSNSLGTENARLAATEIVQYGQKLEQAIKTMIISGCNANQISFERAPFNGTDADYTNPNSPSNFSCHVFHPKGGAINPQVPDPKSLNLKTGINAAFDKKYLYTGSTCVGGVGKGVDHGCWNTGGLDDTELLMVMTDVKESVCTEINKMADVPVKYIEYAANGNYYDSPAAAPFRGTYGLGTDSGHIYFHDVLGLGAASGKRFYCFYDETPAANSMYYVILAR